MGKLSQRLSEVLKKYSNIDLTYQWKGDNADSAAEKFNTFHNKIIKAETIKEGVNDILKWGGIHRIKSQRLEHYVRKILNRKLEIDSDTLLSSWTKILAAYDPQKYFIYDSRVALSLKLLFPEFDWYIPIRRNDEIGRLLRQGYQNPLSTQDSYEKYLKIIKKEDNPSSYEKKLFMLGALVRYNSQRQFLYVLG